ncbi:MAG: SsrA-binding protein SmpB [Candidatus Omnitrophica bacterium]|nr:SsrA-binding protein SmpB [Candidatus Omnitrophota bacterium]
MRIDNKKAHFDYEIIEKIEAGIVLQGPEVKSLREGKGSIKESFARIEDGEVFLYNFYVAPYPAALEKPLPLRKKKLLLNRREIKKLTRKGEEKGLTLVPLAVYFNKRGLAKVEIALAKGKKTYDKRQKIKDKDLKRDIDRKLKRG